MHQRKGGKTAGVWDVYIYNPEGKRFRSKAEIKRQFDRKGETGYNMDNFNFNAFGNVRRTMEGKKASATPKGKSVFKKPTTPASVPPKLPGKPGGRRRLYSQVAGAQLLDETPQDMRMARDLGLSSRDYLSIARDLQWLG